MALSIGTLVGGALFAEIIFSYPGLGTTLLDAITGQDYPLISAITLIITLMVLISMFAIEIRITSYNVCYTKLLRAMEQALDAA